MSRSKIWGYAALVVVSGFVGLWVFTQRAVVPASEQVAATVRSGALQFETGTRLLARQVRDVAAVAARDPALAAALAPAEAARTPSPAAPARGPAVPPAAPPDVSEVAEAAIHAAAALLDVEMGRAPIVGLSRDRSIWLRVGDSLVEPRSALAQALLGSGAAPRHVLVGDLIYAVAVVPAGQGAMLAFGLPIDPRWAERIQAATGADLTFIGAGLVSTLPPADATAVVAAARKGAGGVVDVGRLSGLPLLFAKAPAWRARAMSLSGIDGPVAVVSAPTRAALEPLASFQQVMLLALVALGVLGVALGFSRGQVAPSHVPRELAVVADRIAHGDFDVRVPRMSGTFGTLAAALARASEAGRLGRIGQAATSAAFPGPSPITPVAPVAPATPALTLDVPLHAVPPEEGTAAAMVQAAQAARAIHPRTTQPIRATPVPASRPTPSPTSTAEEEHALWTGVHQEFLRLRADCGESVEGLTWDRFRDKLRRNRDALAQKYACRTVRFQVYAKDGKAALKATPIR